MADPICRWRNTSIKQVAEFTQILPHEVMPKEQAHEIVERNWKRWDGGRDFFRTAYQLASQLGLYYEDDNYFYPRFDHVINMDEAYRYLRGWIMEYYVPNPYTGSIPDSNTPYRFISAISHVVANSPAPVEEIFQSIWGQQLGNRDIVLNLIDNFSPLDVKDGEIYPVDAAFKLGDIQKEVDSNDKKAFFETFNVVSPALPTKQSKPVPDSLQVIWYGAPGTGKSFTIKGLTNEDNSIRTTFHPDTDYSTFVGAYKPTLKKVHEKYQAIQGREEEISYTFVPQAFINAYVEAWKRYNVNPDDPQPFYLVIEEINRGNCAQIFGDLFQLLDREDDGSSSYSIVPDSDISDHLAKQLKDLQNIPALIREGKRMSLPKNLLIYATMNTSDQSLFPIDSAFKRRWDWKYVPIQKPTGKDWRLEVGDKSYDWWEVVRRLNVAIGDATQSEDKKLGYFFARAKNGVISVDAFVSKVLFYLWNDVIKDNEFDTRLITDRDNQQMDFTRFFVIRDGATTVNTDLVEQFVDNIMTQVKLPDEPKAEVASTTESTADEPID